MGNETNHYFGAYLEIKPKKIEREKVTWVCENGHRGTTKFCAICGKEIKQKTIMVSETPLFISDIFSDDYWDDILAVITPPKLRDAGIVIAIGNRPVPSGRWMSIDRYSWDVETKHFPTEKEINEMIRQLEHNYDDIITALRNSPNVEQVTIRTGYVLNVEY